VNSADGRPPPEQFLALIRDQHRGRLKVYLGFAPGVGKTYEMLQEGHQLKRKGVDAVVGVVETHNRAETAALLKGLEEVPRLRIEYKGITIGEMDLDAVLKRHPTIALVDELAHTNAPGSRNPKRFQDVEELLRAGINVITTMNVQHLESLHDVVERFTKVRVKERVPDYVLGEADEIINVDVSAEDLQDRMRAGKIYPADRTERALEHFFTEGNLTRLRELALEEIAQMLDRRRQQRGGNVPGVGSERVMVCVSLRSPNVDKLLRKAARLAARFNAPWYAIYVETPKERTEKVDAATQRRLSDALALAQQLGGAAMPYKGRDFARTVADLVREYGITHLVIGRSQRPWYRRVFRWSPLDELLRAVPGVDVVVVDTN
jgi:two-component system sensor histidine kinase KdpD